MAGFFNSINLKALRCALKAAGYIEIREIRQGFFELDVPTVLCHAFPQVLSAGVSVVTSGSFCVPTAGCRLKRKGHNMKITYKFADGTVSEVEVSEEIGTLIMDSRREEHALQEKERCHCRSLDAIDYEGSEYGYLEDFGESEKETARQRQLLRECFSGLTETQKRRLLLYIKGKTLREIAEMEGTSFQSVDESIKTARKNFRKIFRKVP